MPGEWGAGRVVVDFGELGGFGKAARGDHEPIKRGGTALDGFDELPVGLPVEVAGFLELAEGFASGFLTGFVEEFRAVDLLIVEVVIR